MIGLDIHPVQNSPRHQSNWRRARRWAPMALTLAFILPVSAEATLPYMVKQLEAIESPHALMELGGRVLFAANDGTGHALWKSDGTAAGTTKVADVPEPTLSIAEVNGLGVFAAVWSADGMAQLWASDGTAGGTVPIYDDGNDGWGTTFAKLDGFLLLQRYDSTNDAMELWRTDGTTGGTTIVKAFDPGTGFWELRLTARSPRIGNDIVFDGTTAATGSELWKSDGTEAGTTLIEDLSPGVGSNALGYEGGAMNGSGVFFFRGSDGVAFSTICRTDGTSAGTYCYDDAGVTNDICGFVGDALIFTKYTPEIGVELWTMDPSGVPQVLKDIEPGPTSSHPQCMNDYSAVVDGVLLFNTAPDPPTPPLPVPYFTTQLWRTDGTPAGTTFIHGFNGGAGKMATIRGRAFFFGDGDVTGFTRLWTSDGSLDGTAPITAGTFMPLEPSQYLQDRAFVDVDGRFFMSALEPLGPTPPNYELWAYLFEKETSVTAAPGDTVSSDGEGDGASPNDPLEVRITMPAGAGGTVSIVSGDTGATSSGFVVLGRRVQIDVPDATPADPYRFAFRIDASLIPAGASAATLVITKDGQPIVDDCTGAPGAADPDPCYESRVTLGDGDAELTVRTSTASLWGAAAHCTTTAACVNGDGCCPQACTPATDADCVVSYPTPAPTPVCGTAPASGCRTPTKTGKASLANKKNTLQWKWGSGAATTVADFGAPLTTDRYDVCVYQSGMVTARTMIPPGGLCAGKPCWKANTKGFQYKNKTFSPAGSLQLQLKSGESGKAAVKLQAKGVNLLLPATGPVRVQLRRAADPLCWEATFTAPFPKNEIDTFGDKSD